MKAIRFATFGEPSVLALDELDTPAVGADQALVCVEAASINPSDVKNVAGAMEQTTLPRIPGRDYAGVVEQGPAEWVGAKVWGSGGDVGFTREGTHAQHIVVPVASLSAMPSTLDFAQAASVGVNFLVAWQGLVEGADLQAGETVLIIGANGGVGGAAAQIAHSLGAVVIGADRAPPAPDMAIGVIAKEMLIDAPDLNVAVRGATGGRGAEVIYDCVGGAAMFPSAVRCLAHRGRLIEISATGGRKVTFDLADFYHNESRLIGVDSLKRDLVASGQTLERLRPYFERGDFRPSPVTATFSLDRAEEAYRLVGGGTAGRVVLLPQA